MDTQKIQVIRQAEEQAKTIVANADELAHTTIREAHMKNDSLISEAKLSARSQEKDLLSDYQRKGETQALEILSNLEKELSKISFSAEKHEENAIAYLTEQMKVVYGNK